MDTFPSYFKPDPELLSRKEELILKKMRAQIYNDLIVYYDCAENYLINLSEFQLVCKKEEYISLLNKIKDELIQLGWKVELAIANTHLSITDPSKENNVKWGNNNFK